MQMDPELLAQRKKMQMEIMLKDSDVKKNAREIMQAEIAIREIKQKQNQLQVELVSKENLMKKLMATKMQIQNELIKMKHQMNNLGR